MVAYLTKSDASEGFNQIIDFLNGSSIKYSLTVDEERDAYENVEEVNAGDVAEGDVSAAHGEVSTVVEEPSIRSPTLPTPPPQPTHDIPSTSQRVGTSQRVETSDETVMDDVSNQGMMIAEMDHDADFVLKDDKEVADEAKEVVEDAKFDDSADIQGRTIESQTKIYKIDMNHANKVFSMQEDETEPAEVQEVVDVVTTAKLITKVVTAASETVTAAIIAAPSRRRKGVVIRDLQEESTTSTIIPAETKSKDKGKGILVEEPKPLKKKQQIEQDKQYARELQAELNKNIDWDEAIDHVKKKMDYLKGMSYDDIRPIFEAKFNTNVAFLLKTKKQIKEDENRALRRLNETPAERAAKRKKLDKEVPVVDYQIIEMNNKPYYKIIRADDTHQLYVSFLRNFNREDLEALWSLVKERFSTIKPKNFFDDFLLVALRAMFEKPDIHAQIWKTQRNVHDPVKVKGWKLLESCGMLIITFTST
nr:hypothetical protein [Tanacetum cinerariifolium]